MDPITAILGALSAAGGIISATGGRKIIDPEKLKQLFGPNAVSQEILDTFNHVINSPQGQQMMANAAEQGQQFQNDTNAAAAKAGLAGPEGSSGAGIFATSAANGAVNSLQRQAKGNLYNAIAPIAQQNVANRMSAYLNQPGMSNPTMQQSLGSAIGNAAGVTLANYSPKAAKPTGGAYAGANSTYTGGVGGQNISDYLNSQTSNMVRPATPQYDYRALYGIGQR